MAFLRNLLATLVGLFLFTIIAFLFFAGLIAGAASSEVPYVRSNSILYFPMSGVLEEKTISDPFLEAFGDGSEMYSLVDILDAIRAAKTDPKIKGIYLEPRYLAAGYGALQDVRDALLDFRQSGKFIYAYGEYISESDFYLASVADSLFLNPTGAIEFNGLDANITFFKGMFEKLEIEPQIFRVGTFKSYVEPFIRKDLSPENELQYKELLGSMYETYLSNVSKSIDVPLEELSNVSNEMKVSLPAEAENYGLINKVGFEDELVSVMKSKIGQKETSKLRKISINKYIEAMKADETSAKDKIAVIVAEGDIVMGGDQGIVGETFANEIRKARNNKSIKAIVLRINSGGGSMTASDMIWRELMLTKGKKPIIASMSTAAASGGYYIAMPADSILAQPNTITGSIGIFGMWFNFGQFLENKIGITHDVVKTGKHSDIYTVTRPLTEVEKSIIQKGVNEGYEVFTRKAADARGMLQDDLKKIAEGRVWSGLQAKENGLIDGIGGLQDAIEMASDMAELPEYEVVYLPKEKLFIEDFIEKMSAKVQRSFVKETLDPYLKKVEGLKNFQGIQARMPQLEVR